MDWECYLTYNASKVDVLFVFKHRCVNLDSLLLHMKIIEGSRTFHSPQKVNETCHYKQLHKKRYLIKYFNVYVFYWLIHGNVHGFVPMRILPTIVSRFCFINIVIDSHSAIRIHSSNSVILVQFRLQWHKIVFAMKNNGFYSAVLRYACTAV